MTVVYETPQTPGVYVEEFDAFPPSIVGVATALPAFIGYTEKAVIGTSSVHNQAVKITSMADYMAVFGGAPRPLYTIQLIAPDDKTTVPDVTLAGVRCKLAQKPNTKLYLYNSLRLFYANGGGTCYIVSCGSYDDVAANGVSKDDFEAALAAVEDNVGPTMLVAPDLVLLPPDAVTDPNTPPGSTQFGEVAKLMMRQCLHKQDRFAILDVYGADRLNQRAPAFQNTLDNFITNYRGSIADDDDVLKYGASYFPFLNTTLVQASDVDFRNFDLSGDGDDSALGKLKAALNAVVDASGLPPAKAAAVKSSFVDPINASLVATPADADAAKAQATTVKKIGQGLLVNVPALNDLLTLIATQQSQMPPSGAMAGIYTMTDLNRGVWNAPANQALTGVVGPTLKISDRMQASLNVPLDGKAINAIRDFPGRGTLVWGARTLDGNSNDWRYIQVRRALIYIEQSVSVALNKFVFEPNVESTWVSVTAMISSFLQTVWSQGGLMGATPIEAFDVRCGRGVTMTAAQILQGQMIVQIKLQMVHPAEFIILTFQQQMKDGGG